MRRLITILTLSATVLLMATFVFGAPERQKSFPDTQMAPTPRWSGPVFHLSQNYPKVLPTVQHYPWEKFDFRTQSNEYMLSVLHYCYEGNLDVDWDVERNAVRHWYHAPWLHWGRNGREFIHGLTSERVSVPKELDPAQTSAFQNWAVGMYNEPGGYTIGQVWRNHEDPDASAAKFPVGTVAVKLLFTQADPNQVPYLKNAKEWQAYIYKDIVIPTNPLVPRVVTTMRLLQIDIAVRDSRADSTTGWVFGTFCYNGDAPGTSPWEKMIPVGLMWGNDPDFKPGGSFSEERINHSALVPHQHLGWQGRLDGPVDNPMSSCLSCHSTAQAPSGSPIIPPSGTEPGSPAWMRWFRNVKSGQPFDTGSKSCDYSLQISVGIQNFNNWKDIVLHRGGVINPRPGNQIGILPLTNGPQGKKQIEYPVNREGDTTSIYP
jgi:hypothetical protein